MRRRGFAIVSLGAIAVALTIASWDRSALQSPDARRQQAAAALLDDGVLRAVILGDSVARGAGDETGRGLAGSLDEHFRGVSRRASAVLNLGIDGARTWNVEELVRQRRVRSAIRSADVVVLSIGGNDLYGDSRARLLSRTLPLLRQHHTLARLERLVARIREQNPAARIYLLGLYNPYHRSPVASWLDRQVNLWDGRLIIRFASAQAVRVVRISDLLERGKRLSGGDHFHPGADGYRAIAERIASSL